MNASRATRLLNQSCYINSPDGLVRGTILDLKAAYGTTRVEVEIPAVRNRQRVAEVRTFDAARVLLPVWSADSQTETLTPALEY